MPVDRKPTWLKVRAPGGPNYAQIKETLRERELHTVCEEARCPNVGECWASGTATFMLMGDTCTRGCRFCAVKTARLGNPLDPDEPRKIADSVRVMGLHYVVLTSVDRDDLEDGGAAHFAATVRAIKEADPHVLVEVLVPDYLGENLEVLLEGRPDVFAHNVEVVERLTRPFRDPHCGYRKSLSVLRRVKELRPDQWTKSSLMVGVSETTTEVEQTMRDLRSNGVDVLTIGQYLRPSPKHLEVHEYVHPDQFEIYRRLGEQLGFAFVAAGPLVRSSYRAGELFLTKVLRREGDTVPRPTPLPSTAS